MIFLKKKNLLESCPLIGDELPELLSLGLFDFERWRSGRLETSTVSSLLFLFSGELATAN